MENQALTPLTPAGVEAVTFEIIYLKQQTTQNLIEIGKRLIQVKESLSHGEWLPWLEQKVDFSDQQARRLMKVAEECANSTALLNLPQTKVFALLDLPVDQREEFMNTPHIVASGEVKTVDEMTTRELTQALKDKKTAEERAAAAEKKAELAEADKETLEAEKQKVEAKLKREQQARKEEVDRLAAQIEEAKKVAPSADSTKNIKKLEKELKEAKKEVLDLTERLNAPVTVEAAVVEKVPEEIERELNDLRIKVPELEAKIGQPAPGAEAIVKYSIQFEALVSGFKTLFIALTELKEADPEAYGKYRKATSGLLEKMAGKL